MQYGYKPTPEAIVRIQTDTGSYRILLPMITSRNSKLRSHLHLYSVK